MVQFGSMIKLLLSPMRTRLILRQTAHDEKIHRRWNGFRQRFQKCREVRNCCRSRQESIAAMFAPSWARKRRLCAGVWWPFIVGDSGRNQLLQGVVAGFQHGQCDDRSQSPEERVQSRYFAIFCVKCAM